MFPFRCDTVSHHVFAGIWCARNLFLNLRCWNYCGAKLWCRGLQQSGAIPEQSWILLAQSKFKLRNDDSEKQPKHHIKQADAKDRNWA